MPNERILILEDEPAIGLDIMLNLEQHGYEVVAIATDADTALDIISSEKIDLAIVDINLEGEKSGIEVAEVLDRDYGIPFIYLTSYADRETVQKAAATYPAAYLVKPFRVNDLAPAVRVALTTKYAKAAARFPSLMLINKDRLAKVTASEYRVLELIWQGLSNKEISENLHISINTVKSHTQNLFAKLDASSKTDLVTKVRGV